LATVLSAAAELGKNFTAANDYRGETWGKPGVSAGTALALRGTVQASMRSPRYQMCLPVLYRADGETRWHEGVTVDLSDSGALIDGEMPPRAGTLAVVIPLLSSDGCLTGRARVVRASVEGSDGHGRFAIAVPHFLLQGQAAAIARLDTLHQEC
jgi:hypothetical protein